MRRTQLYLEEDLWSMLHNAARKESSSISELVRKAVRERYLGSHAIRREAMMEAVGIRKDADNEVDSTEYIRGLRRGSRMDRLKTRQ